MDRDELLYSGLARQADLVRSGEVSSRELVEASLERIADHDPSLRAFRVVLGERALAEADQADARRVAGDERPLLGVPIAVKDNADLAGEVTPRGSAGFDPTPRTADAEVVRRLRAAGAVVVGKTAVPELEIFPFTESSAWGITRNPWDRDRTPGGSSGGSAVAVAAGMVPAALGSDGGGSIRIPSACCGLFGIKPQRDRVPLAPVREHWHGLSVYGPIARRVADAALFLDVVAGERPGNEFAAAAVAPPSRLRIVASRRPPLPGPLAPEPRRAWEEAIDLLRGLGHDVLERDPAYGAAIPLFTARYLRGIHDDATAMHDPRRLERRTRGMARLGSLVPASRIAAQREREAAFTAQVNEALAGADALLTPALAQLPLPIERFEGRGALYTFNGVARFTPFTSTWNLTGQPAVAVPMGHTASGVPLGVQLVGRPHDEATLVSLSAQIEATRPWADRRPPLGG